MKQSLCRKPLVEAVQYNFVSFSSTILYMEMVLVNVRRTYSIIVIIIIMYFIHAWYLVRTQIANKSLQTSVYTMLGICTLLHTCSAATWYFNNTHLTDIKHITYTLCCARFLPALPSTLWSIQIHSAYFLLKMYVKF